MGLPLRGYGLHKILQTLSCRVQIYIEISYSIMMESNHLADNKNHFCLQQQLQIKKVVLLSSFQDRARRFKCVVKADYRVARVEVLN